MHNAIRDDTLHQIFGFVTRLRATFDPDRYPKRDDGPEFDAELRALERDFERIKRLFHDCLMAQWSDDIGRELQQQLDSNPPGKGTDGRRKAR